MNFDDSIKIKELLEKENLFIISSHVGADGDNVGSSCGLVNYLKEVGKEAYYVMEEKLPENLSFLYKTCGYLSSAEVKEKINSRQYILITLDCGDADRLQCEKKLSEDAFITINIDHHVSNKGFGKYNLVKDDYSSTCQVVCELLMEVSKEKISKVVATCLYTGLVTDSGNFMYDSAKADTLNIAAFLLTKGANKELIMERLYRNRSVGMIRLLGMVFATLKIENNVAYMYVTQDMLKETGVDYNDTESIVNYAVEIEGIDIGYFIKEKEEDLIKVSLRSKSKTYNVAKIAERIGGGGHIMAAGCTVQGNLEEAKKIISREVKEFIKDV
ncbi:MAG: DHH family phosphoesterase [Filifactoraceae bacterium]